jgi:DNA-binding CsgD family transcriptional regulator
VVNGKIPDEQDRAELLRAGLLIPEENATREYVPLSPREAQSRFRREALERDAGLARLMVFLNRLEGEVAQNGELLGGIEILDDASYINDRIERAMDEVKSEILTAQPGGPRTPASLSRSLIRDTEASARGVRIRTIYADAARTHPLTRARVAHMRELGGETRTCNDAFLRGIILDSSHAFVSDYTDHGRHKSDRAVLIRNPQMIALLRESFEHRWSQSDPWDDEAAPDDAVKLTKTQQAIIKRLCAGRTHQQIATEFGVSTKTIGNHLADARARLGLETAEQLAYWWGQIVAIRRGNEKDTTE